MSKNSVSKKSTKSAKKATESPKGQDYLFKIIRRRSTGEARGVVLVARTEGGPRLGWSLCRNGVDKFNREKAIEIALARAHITLKRNEKRKGDDLRLPPDSLLKPLVEMAARGARYYKKGVIVPENLMGVSALI
jgi:hypothetical protein